MTARAGFALADGTAQAQRLPAAFAGPQRLEIDAFTLAERFAMLAGFADRLAFIDSDGRERGTWGELLRADEAVVLARLCAWDAQREQARLDALQAFGHDGDRARIAQAAAEVVALVGRIDHFLKLLLPQPGAGARTVVERLQHQLPLLSEELGWLRREFAADWPAAKRPRVQRTLARLHAAWGLPAEPAPPAPRPAAPDIAPRRRVRRLALALLGLMHSLRALARPAFEASLASGGHAPAPALLLAFLRLVHEARAPLNEFTERQVDFYYRDCLRMAPRAAELERAHLVLEPLPSPAGAPPATGSELAAGTLLACGTADDGSPVLWRTTSGLPPSAARVAALRTLRLARDPHIWPARLFRWVTEVQADELPVGTPGGPAPGRGSVPLFGGGARAAQEATVGVAIGSRMLHLAEGERRIQVGFELDLAALGTLDDWLQKAMSADDESAFCVALGCWFRLWLLADDSPALARRTAADLQALRGKAARFEGLVRALAEARPGAASTGDVLSLLREGGRVDRALVFDHLFEDLFCVEISTARGFIERPDAIFRRGAPEREGVAVAESAVGATVEPDGNDAAGPAGASTLRGRFTVSCRLAHGDPPLAAWAGAPTSPGNAALPTLRLRADRRARLHPLSLFEGVALAGVELVVSVRGLSQVELHNQLGRLDPGKPFAPFGPLPDTSSYLVAGAAELAGKPLTRLALQMRWAGLPPGGFGEHYQGYGPGWNNQVFRGRLAMLRDGRWLDAGPGGGTVPLFATATAAAMAGAASGVETVSGVAPGLAPGGLLPRATLALDPSVLATAWRADTQPLAFDQGARNGFVRLQLAAPAAGFGHALHPGLLTKVITANVRRRRRQLPLPRAPYTPQLERVTIDYEARARVRPGRVAEAAAAPALRIAHLLPFGVQEIFPALGPSRAGLLPSLGPDGQLFIGLADAMPGDPLQLLFELEDAAADEALVRQRRRLPRRWSALAGAGWQELATHQVQSDSTEGLLTSGTVCLDLPPEATADAAAPGAGGPGAGLHWLRLDTDDVSGRFAGLVTVRARAVLAERVRAMPQPQAAAATPGARVRQPMIPFGGRAAEDEAGLRQRAGERLRHKNRACLAWDVERLVLERFPDVHKVKCFEASAERPAQPGRPGCDAGSLLVAVVPRVPRNDPLQLAQPQRLHAAQLRFIEDYLAERSSPLARIAVRNAVYERVQLRCTVQAARHTHAGQLLESVHEAVQAYLSPWFDGGYEGAFGWSLRGEELQSCIAALPAVRAVSGVSLLHFGESDGADGDDAGVGGGHWLVDTARQPGGEASLRWRTPWSLMLPTARHLIDIVDAEVGDDGPRESGVRQLAIGSTFVVSGPAPLAAPGMGALP